MRKNSPSHIDTPGILSCVGTLLCWSSAPLFIEYLTGHLDLWTQNLLRYGAACLFWLPVLLMAAKAGRLPKRVWVCALLPFIPNIIMQNLWAAAFYYIDPGFASLLATTAFLWVIILSIIFFTDERRLLKNRQFRLSIILSLVGLAGVMFFHPAFTCSYTIIGIAIMLLYGFIWGLYAVAVKAALKDIDARVGFSVVSIYTIVSLFILILFKGRPSRCLEMPFSGWAAVIVSGIVGIAVGHVLYYISIRRLGSTTPSLVQLAQPFVVVVISYVIFGESLSALQLIFGVVLIAGSALAILSKRTPLPTG
ncbi:MAG: DMT family transporter [Sedimentisphaerales bacterium]|nr:DMT family transporter [Sedimentisphaerales bacterium]